jgi:hypothetical protein
MRNCAAQCSGVSPVKGDTLPQSALASASAMIVGTSSSAAAMCTACAYRHHVRDDAQDAPITPTITLAHYALALPPNESRRSTLGRGRRSHTHTRTISAYRTQSTPLRTMRTRSLRRPSHAKCNNVYIHVITATCQSRAPAWYLLLCNSTSTGGGGAGRDGSGGGRGALSAASSSDATCTHERVGDAYQAYIRRTHLGSNRRPSARLRERRRVRLLQIERRVVGGGRLERAGATTRR